MIKVPTRAALLLLFAFHAHTAMAVPVPSASFPSIQSAINAVVSGALPNGTVIDVSPGTYTEFLLVNNTNKSMTVRGVAGAASTVVKPPSGGLSVLRVFDSSGAVRFEGLTLQNGNGPDGQGGGFTLLNASPTFVACMFLSNTARMGGGGSLTNSNAVFDGSVFQSNTSTSHGGGVVIVGGSRPLFTNSFFIGNVSGAADATGSGGAVHVNDASPTFRNTSFTSNRSKFAAGAIVVIGNYGSTNGTATIVLDDCTIANNTSVRQGDGWNPSEGGGMHIEDNTIAYLTRTVVASNAAGSGAGLSSYRARYEIAHSIIESNIATPIVVGAAVIGGLGGGIAATSNNVTSTLRPGATVNLTDTVIRNNSAFVGGGVLIGGDHTCGTAAGPCGNGATANKATLRMTDTLLYANFATQQGGGVSSDRALLTVGNSHILGNVASSFYGGGLSIFEFTQASITNSTIANNSAGQLGGGINLAVAAVLNVTGSRIYKNTAGVHGGGMWVNSDGPSGTISGNVIAGNTGEQIGEQACTPKDTPILTYTNNNIVPNAGQSDFYFGTCTQPASTISAFNALPKTSGNTSTTPNFSSFMATPGVGPTSVLSWAAAGASTVTINGVSSTGAISAKDVKPTARTTYTMTSTGPTRTAVVTALVEWGVATDFPVPGDYDGDGKTDMAVYRPSTGQWFIIRSSGGTVGQTWGNAAAGDRPVPADYDGDGRTDIAVYRQTTGEWFIIGSTAGVSGLKWGEPSLGDIPVPGDYDNDGKANLAVYRTSTGQWFARQTNGGVIGRNWGVPAAGDTPVPGDYDGDGSTDFAVYRTSNGVWFVQTASGATLTYNWGVPSLQDVPVPADYDGDGRVDAAVVRMTTGQWFVLNSSGGSQTEQWGGGGFRVPGDYDFNHADDFAVFTPGGRWAVRR